MPVGRSATRSNHSAFVTKRSSYGEELYRRRIGPAPCSPAATSPVAPTACSKPASADWFALASRSVRSRNSARFEYESLFTQVIGLEPGVSRLPQHLEGHRRQRAAGCRVEEEGRRPTRRTPRGNRAILPLTAGHCLLAHGPTLQQQPRCSPLPMARLDPLAAVGGAASRHSRRAAPSRAPMPAKSADPRQDREDSYAVQLGPRSDKGANRPRQFRRRRRPRPYPRRRRRTDSRCWRQGAILAHDGPTEVWTSLVRRPGARDSTRSSDVGDKPARRAPQVPAADQRDLLGPLPPRSPATKAGMSLCSKCRESLACFPSCPRPCLRRQWEWGRRSRPLPAPLGRRERPGRRALGDAPGRYSGTPDRDVVGQRDAAR
jgi:hypothetical protein